MSGDNFDTSKDYYSILGVLPTATIDEIKNAHIRLALRYHPDMNIKNSTESDKQQISFVAVSEAWFVLSKPDLRQKYDTIFLKKQILSHQQYSSSQAAASFTTQRDNYVALQKSVSQSDWKDNLEKYKSEKWQRLDLKDKKTSRQRPITSVGRSFGQYAIQFAVIFGSCYGLYLFTSSSFQKKRNENYK